MKKKVTLILALAMLLSLSACGSKTETAENTAPEAEITTAADETADEAQTDTESEEATEETTAETEAEVIERADIKEASPCYNGGIMFRTSEKGPYYYRFSDKKLFDLSEYEFYSEYVDSVCVSGSIAKLVDKIVNIDTNEVLYDLSNNAASIVENWGRGFGNSGALVISVPSQSFDEEPSIVVLKNDGSIAAKLTDTGIDNAIAVSDRYLQFSDPTTRPGTTIYDMLNMTDLNLAANSVQTWCIENENCLYYMDREANIVQYNKNTGAANIMIASNEYTDTTWINSKCPYGIQSGYSEIAAIDTKNDTIVHFDISSFVNKCDQNSVWLNWVCSKYVLVSCKRSGNSYIAMLDCNGNTFFEPIAIDKVKTIGCNDNYIVYSDEKVNFVYDIEANNITYLDEGLTIKSTDIENNIFLVKDSDGNYFLANAAAPNDLYSPFDDCVQ